MDFANRVKTLTPSQTLAITAKAKNMKEEGHDVLSLGAGEPDFNTPSYIIEAAKKAMDDGKTKYTPTGGIPELKQAVIDKYTRDNGIAYTPEEVIITTGAKHALYALFQVLLNEGDEVIVPAPYWVSYPEQVKLAEGEPVIVHADESSSFKLTPEKLRNAITSRTKAIIINSPGNPTGMMYTADELQALGEICLEHDIIIVSDEIYEKLIYTEDPHVSMAALSASLKEQTVVINGHSKSHAMTGWRIGYALANTSIIQAMTNLASHATSNPASISQYAALAAYTSDDDPVADMRSVFQERMERLYALLDNVPDMTCIKPKGAFYLFPNVSESIRKGGFSGSTEWAQKLLEEEKVALIPGNAFGAPDNVRLSYAASMDTIMEAGERIHRFINNHQS